MSYAISASTSSTRSRSAATRRDRPPSSCASAARRIACVRASIRSPDRLGLREIELAAQHGAARELARQRRARAGGDERGEHRRRSPSGRRASTAPRRPRPCTSAAPGNAVDERRARAARRCAGGARRTASRCAAASGHGASDARGDGERGRARSARTRAIAPRARAPSRSRRSCRRRSVGTWREANHRCWRYPPHPKSDVRDLASGISRPGSRVRGASSGVHRLDAASGVRRDRVRRDRILRVIGTIRVVLRSGARLRSQHPDDSSESTPYPVTLLSGREIPDAAS